MSVCPELGASLQGRLDFRSTRKGNFGRGKKHTHTHTKKKNHPIKKKNNNKKETTTHTPFGLRLSRQIFAEILFCFSRREKKYPGQKRKTKGKEKRCLPMCFGFTAVRFTPLLLAPGKLALPPSLKLINLAFFSPSIRAASFSADVGNQVCKFQSHSSRAAGRKAGLLLQNLSPSQRLK